MQSLQIQQEDKELQEAFVVLEPPSHAFPDIEKALEEFHHQHTVQKVTIEEHHKKQSWWRQPWIWSPVLFGAACWMFFVAPWWITTTTPSIAKGLVIELWYTSPALGFRAKQKAQSGDTLEQGTQIQLKFQGNPKHHGMFVMLNQEGQLTILAPLQGKQSVPWSQLQQRLSPLELDDYRGKERIFALSSQRSFASKKVKEVFQQAFRQANRRLLQAKPGSNRWQVVWSLWYNKKQRKLKKQRGQL